MGNLLSQLVEKKVVYDFRQEDLQNQGQGCTFRHLFSTILLSKNY